MFKKITKTPVTPLPIDSNSFTASEWNSLNNEVYNLFKNYFPEPDYFFNTIPSEAGIEDVTPYALQSLDMLKSLDNDDTYYIDEDSFEYVPYGDLQQLYKFKIYSGKKNKNNVLNTNDTNNLIQQRTPNIIKFYKFDIPFFLDSNNEPYIKKDVDFDITIESDDFLLTGVTLGEVNINTKQYYESVGDYVYDITLKRRDNTSIYDFLKKESSGLNYTLNEYKYFDSTNTTDGRFFKIKVTQDYYGTEGYSLYIKAPKIGVNQPEVTILNKEGLFIGTQLQEYRDSYDLDKNKKYIDISHNGYITLFSADSNSNIVIYGNSILGDINTQVINPYHFTTKKYVDDAIANNTGSFDYSLEEYKFTGYDDITSAVTIKTTWDLYFNYSQRIYSLIFSPATEYGNVETYSVLNNTGLFLGKLTTPDFQGNSSDFDKTNDYINLVNYGEYNESYIELFNKPSNSKIKISGDYILGDANTKITNDYNFTTKKYVDEKIGVIFCSSRKLIQQNTNNKTLAGQSFYRPIDFCNILATGGYENSKSFTKQGNTNSVLKETNMVNGYQRQLVIGISFGHNNTMSSKKVECSVVLKRGDGTLVRGGNSMIFYDTQTRLQTSTTLTVTLDTADAFVSQGWYLEIQNLNDANDGGSVLTFSTIDILINVVQLPKLAGV